MQIKDEFRKLIPPLSAEEFKQLEANCLADGIRDAILTWNGYIIDGHNRYEIAQRHGLTFKTESKEFESIYDAKEWIFNNQLGRRNLNDIQRDKLMGQLFNNRKQKHGGDRKSKPQNEVLINTAEAIADEYNTSRATVERSGNFATGLEHLTPELEQDIMQGKVKVNKSDIQELAKAEPFFVATTEAEITKKANEIKKAKQQEKADKAKKQKQQKAEAGKLITNLDIDFRLGDFEEVFKDIPDGSIDCIITDPPYPFEYIECWTKLGRFAKRVLKKNGFCIAYSGQMHLPEVMKRMTEHLTYYWTISLIHKSNKQLIMGRNVFCGWKPILLFQNGFSKIDNKIEDIITGSGIEKDYHRWQQSEIELVDIFEAFTNVGDKVIDPFGGGGTTAVVAKKLNRFIYMSEIDEETFYSTKTRLHE